MRRILALTWLANVAPAMAVLAFLASSAPELGRTDADIGAGALIALAYSVVLAPVARTALTRRITAAESDKTSALRAPRDFLALTVAGWAGGALLLLVFASSQGATGTELYRDGAAVGTGAFASGALIYLLVERHLRPVRAALFSDGLPSGRTVGIRWRLLVGWVMGSAVPLLLIAGGEISTSPADPRLSPRSTLVLVLVGLTLGGALVLITAKGLAEPLDTLERAVRRVQAGDLEAHVAVDEPGELGRLQAGFNAMVDDLRKRRELEDLFGRYVSEDIARDALDRGVTLGGEQRDASVLFIDLTNSTALAEQTSPTKMVELLNAFFEMVVRAVEDCGGWINKFQGDAALCVFGVPVPRPDHAGCALRAATRLRAGVAELSHRFPGLDAGVGVSCGTVVAGNVGAARRFEYTVIGDPVNEAARLVELAKARPGRIAASDSVIRAAGSAAAGWEATDSTVVRGRSVETVIYEPVTA